jgi:hypothetical protein
MMALVTLESLCAGADPGTGEKAVLQTNGVSEQALKRNLRPTTSEARANAAHLAWETA